MRLTRAVLPAAVAIGLIVAAPAPAAPAGHVPATAAGSDGPPPVLPSIVARRINRGELALQRAGDFVDQEQPEKAVVSLRNARRNMYAAWRNAVDVVENTPAPVPAGDARVNMRVPVRGKARTSATYLSPDETAVAVLNFQHDVATAAFDPPRARRPPDQVNIWWPRYRPTTEPTTRRLVCGTMKGMLDKVGGAARGVLEPGGVA